MDYVVVFALGMLAATLLIRWMACRAMDQFMESFAVAVDKRAEEKQLCVNLEFDQNIYFLYNSNDGSFVAQGRNLQELKNNLNQRFSDLEVKIVKGDLAALETLKNQIKDCDENSSSVRPTS
jgi:hypothetical protein